MIARISAVCALLGGVSPALSMPHDVGAVASIPAAGSVQAAIAAASAAYWGSNTSSGPDGGVEACAWAVNNVMTNAGLPKIGSNPNYVPSVVDALQAGQGVQIDEADTVPGDLAVACEQQHIGIVMGAGGKLAYSNSSSKKCFCWSSDGDFSGYFSCGGSTFWRVVGNSNPSPQPDPSTGPSNDSTSGGGGASPTPASDSTGSGGGGSSPAPASDTTGTGGGSSPAPASDTTGSGGGGGTGTTTTNGGGGTSTNGGGGTTTAATAGVRLGRLNMRGVRE